MLVVAEPCGTPSAVAKADCGIYLIRNTHNGKVYVGRSVGVWKRWLSHRRSLREGTHKNPHLQAAWEKYGENTFVFEVVERVEDESTLPLREGFHMNRLNACDRDHGYNSVEMDEEAQVRFSEEHKAKISAALMGHSVSEENRRAMSEALRGRPQGTEERERRAEAQRGQKHTEATKDKIRTNGNLGRKFGPLSPEHRQKLSEARKGKKRDPAIGAKVSKALRGRVRSEEHCQKLSEALTGKKRSVESVERQRETLRGRVRSPEAVEKTAAALRGRTRSPEERQRIRDGIRAARLRREAEESE